MKDKFALYYWGAALMGVILGISISELVRGIFFK